MKTSMFFTLETSLPYLSSCRDVDYQSLMAAASLISDLEIKKEGGAYRADGSGVENKSILAKPF